MDLGGGRGGMMFDLAVNRTGAQMYINVDRGSFANPNPPNSLEPASVNPSPDKSKFIIKVKADMLDFLARIKDGSANFAINGIDEIIINDHRYHQALATELVRATKPGGLIFGLGSEVIPILRGQIDRREIDLTEHIIPRQIHPMMPLGVFEKPE